MSVIDRREIGRKVAEVRRQARQVLGAERIAAEMELLDERTLGRRRLASEERKFRGLQAELDALPSEPDQEHTS